jgi:hypothetical protein
MSLQPHPLPPLLKEEVNNHLMLDQPPHLLDVLRWLVWLSLLSREELGRVLQRDEQTLWGHLNTLMKQGLVDSVILNETGWPLRHHRYHITDLGLYVLAASHTPALSAHKIAMSYPITRADLFERLARPRVHLLLSDLITRLITECPPGYRLTSYQQPYKQTYLDLSAKKHTITFDAAFLLQTPASAQHAFYLHVDQPEHLFSQKEAKSFIKKLFALRRWMHLQRESMPHLLLLSGVERFSFWSEHLERLTLNQGISLLNGSLGETKQMSRGAYTPLWIPFQKLPKHDGHVQESDLLDLLSLLEHPASPRIIEQFSQSFTFKNMLRRKETGALSKKSRALRRYVDVTLQQEALPLAGLLAPQIIAPAARKHRPAQEILNAFYADREERLAMSTQFTLALSSQQKDILALLTRHPYLSQPDLLTLLYSENQHDRLLSRQMNPLIHLDLVSVSLWSKAPVWREKERYILDESMLRFFAMRHGLSPAYYLYPHFPSEEDRGPVSPFSRDVTWLQHGAPLLRQQMAHTAGLYRCIRHILIHASPGTYHIHYWKSAQEALSWTYDPFNDKVVSIRPDAELLYSTNNLFTPRSLLIEYDRATTDSRAYKRKFRGYADYQAITRTTLPPLLVITQNEQSKRAIQQAIVHEKAFDVQVHILLESQVMLAGLLPILLHLS